MSSGVKTIFKTLIKVPVIILASYMIFNLFAFSLTYFRLLGFSYVVMQTAVENNYIPPDELVILQNYLNSISNTGVLGRASLILEDEENGDILEATVRRQYGMPVTVGLTAQYKFVWPLMPREQLANEDEQFIGYGPGSSDRFSGFADENTLEQRRLRYEDNERNNIKFIYTVPGLKYYPDLR